MLKKFYSFSFALIAIAFTAFSQVAQDNRASGIIYYDQVIDMKSTNTTITGASGGSVAFSSSGGAHLPDKIVNKFEIMYSPAGAKFQKSVVDESASNGLVVRIGGRDLFFNNDKVIESFELDGEPLMIENKLGHATLNPEKSDETKVIAGFICKKAVVTGPNNAKTTVWYTTDLNLKASPMAPFWVEGVTLGIENDRMKMMATSIDYTKVKDSEFALPKKAKMLTQEEYTKKMADFREKMGNGVMRTSPGGGTTIIRTN